MNGAQEVASRFVVARGDGSVLLEAGEEVLDQMARLVQRPVMIARLFAPGARGDHHRFAFVDQRLDQSGLGVIGLVGNEGLPRRVLEQDIGALQVVALAGREVKARRIAQGIDRGVNLGAQSASAASDRLLVQTPPFAPALCWWARTMVASIMTHSLSASCDRASKTRRHTPPVLQREWRVCTTRKSPKRAGRSRQGMPAR